MSYSKAFTRYCKKYSQSNTSQKYQLLCERGRIEKVTEPIITILQEIDEVMSGEQVQEGGFTIPYLFKTLNQELEAILYVPENFWQDLIDFPGDKMDFTINLPGVTSQGEEIIVNDVSITEIIDGLRDTAQEMEIFEKGVTLSLSGTAASGGIAAFTSWCSQVANESSERVRQYALQAQSVAMEIGSSAEGFVASLWAMAGASYLSLMDKFNKEGRAEEFDFKQAFAAGTNGFSGAYPLAMVFNVFESYVENFSTVIPKIAVYASGLMSFVAAGTFSLFLMATLGLVKGTIGLFGAIAGFFNAENIVVSDTNPDDLSIDFGGVHFWYDINTDVFDTIGGGNQDHPVYRLKSMLDNPNNYNKSICAVLPGCTLYAFAYQDQSAYYNFVLRKHLVTSALSKPLRRIFGDGDQLLDIEDVEHRLEWLEKSSPASAAWTPEDSDWGRLVNYSALEAMYNLEESIPYVLELTVDPEVLARRVGQGDMDSSFVNITPTGDTSVATNLNMAKSCCVSINNYDKLLIIKALSAIVDADSEYDYCWVSETLKGRFNVPTDNDIYTRFTRTIEIAAATVVIVAATTALTVALCKFKTFARGNMGKRWAEYLKLSNDPNTTPEQIGAAYGKYNWWSKLAGVNPMQASAAGFSLLSSKEQSETVITGQEDLEREVISLSNKLETSSSPDAIAQAVYNAIAPSLNESIEEVLSVITGEKKEED